MALEYADHSRLLKLARFVPPCHLPLRYFQTDESMLPRLVTVGQVTASPPALDVACDRGDLLGRLHCARSISEHAADVPVPDLRHFVAADRWRSV
jgi:hypothetical protein